MKVHLDQHRQAFASVTTWVATAIAVGSLFHALAQRPAQGPMSPQRETPESLGYELFWQDDFNGNALDPQKWAVRGVGPRALGFVSPEAVTVEDGYLKLHAIKKDDRILLGAVGTQGCFMTRYGYFECRAQLQKSPGVWGAFWIQSTEIPSKPEEIRNTVFPDVFVVDHVKLYKKRGR